MSAQPLVIQELAVRAFRNLASVDLRPSPRFNVLFGDNGQGKTNLLEAVYALATSKSFRAQKPGELVMHDTDAANVRARLDSLGLTSERSLGLAPAVRSARVDGKRPSNLAEFARSCPVVLFHPGELSLSIGPAAPRRTLLDRLGLYLNPSTLVELASYTRAVRSRQKLLETRGIHAREIGDFEVLIAQHGARVAQARRSATESLIPSALEAFARIADPKLHFEMSYREGGPEDQEGLLRAFAENRAVDLRRGGAIMGPHKCDLELTLGGRLARTTASQGQHRAMVLSLKAAEITVVSRATLRRPILLLDDVSSELDPTRTVSLFSFLQDSPGQVFLTTTRRELIDTGPTAERADFRVQQGQIERV